MPLHDADSAGSRQQRRYGSVSSCLREDMAADMFGETVAAGAAKGPDPRPRLLLIEDDISISEFLVEILEASYLVDWVSDAATALVRISALPPDVVLTDCILPHGSVFDVIVMAKAVGAAVVVMSGDPGLLESFEQDGFLCLTKPFGSAALLLAIAASLDKPA